MRITEYFKLGKTQPSLPFLDVDIRNDVKLFVNARALRMLETDWGEFCTYLLQNFFEEVLGSIRTGDDEKALRILTQLKEPNETHLGLSKGISDGRGLGPEKAKQIWFALSNSQAVKTGRLSDLEDTVLLIPGISNDILSDMITNVIRGPLISFTQEMCEEYGIPLADEVASGPVWNPIAKEWDNDLVSLPVIDHEKLILVPKAIVRLDGDYNVSQYYRHYILERLKEEEKAKNSGLVHILKSGKRKGEKKVYKKDLEEKYGSQAKTVAIEQTERHPDLLEKYKRANSAPTPAPSHDQLAELQGTEKPNWQDMLEAVLKLTPGKKHAYLYEEAIHDLLSALFYPVLVDPKKQTPIHDGMKRVDITFSNYARTGFFEWLARHYPSSHIFIECKNFGEEIGNPEVDQIAMRFSKARGMFGIILCRKVEDKTKMLKRCQAAAKDGHGYVIVLDDDDLTALVEEVAAPGLPNREFKSLKAAFDGLIF